MIRFRSLPSFVPRRRLVTAVVAAGVWGVVWGSGVTSESGPKNVFLWWSLATTVLVTRLLAMRLVGFASSRVRFATFGDFLRLSGAMAGATLVVFPFAFFVGWGATVTALVEAAFSWATLMALAAWPRAWREWRRWIDAPGEQKRVLVWGCSDAEELLLRSLRQHPENLYQVVGLIGEHAAEIGMRIDGVPVVATTDDWQSVALRRGVDELFVVSGRPTGNVVRRLRDEAESIRVRLQVLPSYHQLLSGDVRAVPRPVSIEDLLQRKTIELHSDVLARWLEGRRVLVTGAAGSIGSELSRQILACGPERVILVDRSEQGVFELGREHGEDPRVAVCLADVTHDARMDEVFGSHRPEIVFHAAAYKHVPVLEEFPQEAVRNIVGATIGVVRAAERHGVESLVLVSTDKAVSPTSVMGACKRIAERYLQAIADDSPCRLVAVRFGNVLDSAGSVVPIFREQIARGEALTVTHPEMRRFFMTIPEAAQLVLHAGAMGCGGEIFVLKMGEPVSIVELARELIRLSGLVPEVDVPIRVSGLRPGEKLRERLVDDGERLAPTSHPDIEVVESQVLPEPEFAVQARSLVAFAQHHGADGLKQRIGMLVPEYQPIGEHSDCIPRAA